MFLFRLVVSVGLVIYLVGCQTTTAGISPRGALTAVSLNAGKPPAMDAGSEVLPPFGFIGFCLRHTDECETGPDVAPAALDLTGERWRDLREVNEFVNTTIEPVEDIDLYHRTEWWTYPSNGAGDCEDYALLKRKLLIERGWPADALLLSVVKEANGDGHAVLTVVTQDGDYVLDNQHAEIVLWKDAPYTWVKRQSRTHPYSWVNLDPQREVELRLAAADTGE
ncbi:transglutaminase-like cysteine peptidase [Tepidicaulis sp. LMO-SS28]|uniref:transglutaminase-like cysteine peptidase n=1 Tax=Tepidicaulis sp. LMO-SS28 TaxID=3447455 RepID=UPI003EE39677